MKKFLFVPLLLVVAVAGVLFTSLGQKALLIPVAESILAKKLPGHKIRFATLDPGLGSFRAAGRVDDQIAFEVSGPVSWLAGPRLDLHYTIDAPSYTLRGRRYRLDLAIRGALRGTPGDLNVTGAGRGFGGPIDYRTLLRGERIVDTHVRAEGLKLAGLLALAGTGGVAAGRLDVVADLPQVDPRHPEGRVDLHVRNGMLLAKGLAPYGVALPENLPFRFDATLRAVGRLFKGDARFASELLSLHLPDLAADAGLRVFKSSYMVRIPELSRLAVLTHAPLRGTLVVRGKGYYDRRDGRMQLLADTPSLGGDLRAFLDGKRLKVRLRRISIPRVLSMLSQPRYVASGTLDGTVVSSNIRSLALDYDLHAAGSWNSKALAKLAPNLPIGGPFHLDSKGKTTDGTLAFDAVYRDTRSRIRLEEGRFVTASGSLEAKYRIDVPDLHSLAPTLHGAFALAGKVLHGPGGTRVSGSSSSLGGSARFALAGKRLEVDLQNVRPDKLLAIAGQEPWFAGGALDLKLRLSDLAAKKGTVSYRLASRLRGAVLKRHISTATGEDLPLQSRGEGALDGVKLSAKAEASLPKMRLELPKIVYRFASGSLQTPYTLAVSDLGALRPLSGKRYRGPFHVGGTIAYAKTLRVSGNGKEWGGTFDFRLAGNRLRAGARGIRIEKLLYALGDPALLEGRIESAAFGYDTAARKGKLSATARSLRFVQSPFTQAASLVLGRDLSREIFRTAKLDGVIVRDLLTFDFDSRSKNLRVWIDKGKLDTAHSRIDTKVRIDHHGKVYGFQVKGDLSHPLVRPLMTDALKSRIGHEIKKHKLDKKLKKVIPKGLRKALPGLF